MNYFDNNDHLTTEGIALYADALKLDKTANLPDGIQVHIEDCHTCHTQAIELYANVKVVDYASLGPHPVLDVTEDPVIDNVQKVKWPLFILFGIIALLLFIVPKIINQPIPDTPENQEIITDPNTNPPALPKDSVDLKGRDFAEPSKQDKSLPGKENKDIVPEKGTQELIAQDFIPNPELENLIGDVFRSDIIEVSDPVIGAKFKTSDILNFNWSGNFNEPLIVKVFDNINNEILMRGKVKSPYQVTGLSPGLYYWKLETKDDLLYVGKFIVEDSN